MCVCVCVCVCGILIILLLIWLGGYLLHNKLFEWPLKLQYNYLTITPIIYEKTTADLPLSAYSEIGVNNAHADNLLLHYANSYLRSLDVQLIPWMIPWHGNPLPAMVPWISLTVDTD